MFALIHLFIALICNRFRSWRRLEIENLYLRHQLNIAMRCAAHRLRLRRSDRALLVWMTWLWPNLLCISRGPAGHDPALAPSRVSSILALEVSWSARPDQCRRLGRTPRLDVDEHCVEASTKSLSAAKPMSRRRRPYLSGGGCRTRSEDVSVGVK